MIAANLGNAFGTGQLVEALAVAPCERRAMGQGGLLISFGIFKGVGVFIEQANPFDLLLIEAKRASAPRAPSIIIRKPEAGGFKKLNHPRLIDRTEGQRVGKKGV